MEKTEEVPPEIGLYNVGEYYLKNKRYFQAKYVFSRYLTYYPSGRHAAQAAKSLEMTESQAGGAMPQAVSRSSAPVTPSSIPSADSFSAKPQQEQLGNTEKIYYDAVSMISQEKYQQAYLSFRKIVEVNEDQEYVAKSSYEIGRCLFLLSKYDDCIKYFTGMITKYPRHPDLGNCLYFMGQSYEKLGRKDQAATFYKKILTMTTDDDDNAINIKAKRALKALMGE
jgi:TolA-binding protein